MGEARPAGLAGDGLLRVVEGYWGGGRSQRLALVGRRGGWLSVGMLLWAGERAAFLHSSWASDPASVMI